jgi:hypothetical protein
MMDGLTCKMKYIVPAAKQKNAPSMCTTMTLDSWKLATISRPKQEVRPKDKATLLNVWLTPISGVTICEKLCTCKYFTYTQTATRGEKGNI